MPETVLFLFSDTGAGHRRAAEAVTEALGARYPGQFLPVLCDPLAGPGAARLARSLARIYGPAVRWAPWAWGLAYHATNSRAAVAVVSRTAFLGADTVVRDQVAAAQPAVVVCCHPLTIRPAMLAARPGRRCAGRDGSGRDGAGRDGAGRDGSGRDRTVPVLTVTTDLAGLHASWRYPRADLITVPTAQAAAECLSAGLPPDRCTVAGLPVHSAAQAGPTQPAERLAMRRHLGLPDDSFVVLLTGGGEGCGRLGRRATAIAARLPGVHVVVACGRNERLHDRLHRRLAGQADGVMTVLGFVANFTDWLRCADVVVSKAGPGVIAEAACCGTPLLLTSHLPGQERRNIEIVERTGAGRAARRISAMVRELDRMRADPAVLAAARDGCLTLASPAAAGQIADLIAGLAGPRREGPVGAGAGPAGQAGP
jgi:1,2-diacylglycerol 3-beta-galactosyltransferase